MVNYEGDQTKREGGERGTKGGWGGGRGEKSKKKMNSF